MAASISHVVPLSDSTWYALVASMVSALSTSVRARPGCRTCHVLLLTICPASWGLLMHHTASSKASSRWLC
jgi:hypothetical protein